MKKLTLFNITLLLFVLVLGVGASWAVCGNGILEEGEQCDDGNTINGDGCTEFCDLEPSVPVCGNGILEGSEQCDDGNTVSGDGCSEFCDLEPSVPVCGNGILEEGEQCDDGNTVSGDGCSEFCDLEPPVPVCGNGILEGSEQCDDGNTVSGDGCSEFCDLEPPVPVCGNGILEEGEQCDDGNTYDGDGCSANCNIEPSACRVTAGGNKTTGPDGLDTWGGQAGAPPIVDGNWTHSHKVSKKVKFLFHSNDIFNITCSDPGDFCAPARYAPNRQIDFAGIGRFVNQKGFSFPTGDLCFTVHLEDLGEPGPGGKKNNVTALCTHCPGTPIDNMTECPNCTDYYMIRIYGNAECTGDPIYVNGPGVPANCMNPGDPQLDGYFIDTGNVQIHPDNNGP